MDLPVTVKGLNSYEMSGRRTGCGKTCETKESAGGIKKNK